MSTEQEKSEVKGKFRFEKDSKRYHRFQIETNVGIVGTVYVPKSAGGIPSRLILENANKDE